MIISRLDACAALNSNGEILSLGLQTASRNASLQSVTKCIKSTMHGTLKHQLRFVDLGKRRHGCRRSRLSTVLPWLRVACDRDPLVNMQER